MTVAPAFPKIKRVYGGKPVAGLTIDDAGTRDIDDAIWVEQSATEWTVTVAIADVAGFVKDESVDDLRAREMVETKYFATGNSPMLRRDLSEDHLSLWPGQKRRVLAVSIAVDKATLTNTKVTVAHAVLNSMAKLTYREIPALLATDPLSGGEVCHMLVLAASLARALLDKRRADGAFVLYDLNNGWVTSEEGFLRRIESHDATIGYIIIQELMILANSAIAHWAVDHDVPILFRNHVARSAAPDRAELQRQLDGALTMPFQGLDALRQRTHLLLDRASYGSSVSGHYGLNLPVYTHFTSPIRRYADLINHRQIRRHLKDGTLFYSKAQITAFAEHIVAVTRADEVARSRAMKEQCEKKAVRAIDARRLDGLAHKDFERVTKVEARSGQAPSAAFTDAFSLRTNEDKTSLLAMAVILTQAPMTDDWRPLRATIVAALARRPEDAVSVLAQAPQLDPRWAAPRYQLTNMAIGEVPVFEVMASVAIEGLAVTVMGTASAKQKKRAEQLAAVALLANMAGVPVPDPNGMPPTVSPKAPVPVAPTPSLNPSKDPISTLQEWCQIAGVMPSYTFEASGPSHIPVMVCTCKVRELTVQSKAGSKIDAKRGAAIEMIRVLNDARPRNR